MPKVRSSRTSRLARGGARFSGRDTWLQAGQAVLLEEGIAGMRLHKLTKRVDVSTGSFYHHFKSMDDFLSSLASFYSSDLVEREIEQARGACEDPIDQIRYFIARGRENDLYRVDNQLRIWAASDPRAAVALSRGEASVAEFLSSNLLRAGFSAQESVLRARLFIAASVVNMAMLTSSASANFRRDAFHFLIASPLHPEKSTEPGNQG